MNFDVEFFIRFKPQTLLEIHPARHTTGQRIPSQGPLLFANSRELRRALLRAGISSSIADIWGWRGPIAATKEQVEALGFVIGNEDTSA